MIQAQHAKLKEQAGVNELTLERQDQIEQLKKQLADTQKKLKTLKQRVKSEQKFLLDKHETTVDNETRQRSMK